MKRSTFDRIISLFEAPYEGVDFDRDFCVLLKEAFDVEYSTIFEVDAHDEVIRFRCAPNLGEEIIKNCQFKMGEGICGAAAHTLQTIAVHDAGSRPEHNDSVDIATGLNTRSLLAAPVVQNGRCIAVLELMNRREGCFGEEDKRLARCMAALYATRMSVDIDAKDQPRSPKRRQTSQQTVMVGATFAMQRILDRILKIGPTELPVLIIGETGTGKELIARRVHEASHRRDQSCLTINCAALTESLLESELFGHVKGAFTGAQSDRRGLLEEASGGTIFLDEVGDMTPACQAKLLRALDYGEIIPVGGNQVRAIDVRVIAATNLPLDQQVRKGHFRADLYHRLCGAELHLPPLREREDDVELLAQYFLGELTAVPMRFSPEAMAELKRYSWPGNIRELRRVVEIAIAMAEGPVILPGHLPDRVHTQPAAQVHVTTMAPNQLASHDHTEILQAVHNNDPELIAIRDALLHTAYPGSGRWNIAAAARRMGMARKTLEYKIKSIYRIG